MADPETDESADEIEARAKLYNAKARLAEARWGFFDRVVMRGVIPVALAIAAPIATYYFSAQAETGIEEVRKVSDSVKQLDQLIAGIRTSAARHEEARMAELTALRDAVSALQWTIVVQRVRDSVQSYGRQALYSEIQKSPRPDFAQIRTTVEKNLFERLSTQVDADPELIRGAIRGAVDEIAPEFEMAIKTRGGDLDLPNEPRFPTKKH